MLMFFCKNAFYFMLLALLSVLTGCVSHHPPLPNMSVDEMESRLKLPRQLWVIQINPVSHAQPDNDPLWQVVVQREGNALRWLRFDLLGAPDARQILQSGQWHNDGFITPNRQAQELFAALLFAWIEESDWPLAYDKTQRHANLHLAQSQSAIGRTRELKENQHIRWTVHWLNSFKADEFSIKTHVNGIVWKVRPIDKNE